MTSGFEREEAAVLGDLTHDHRRKIPALTGIRGYAALWVVMFHCASIGWRQFNGQLPADGQIPVIGSGYLGVELFFVLSGFILVKIYGRSVSSVAGVRDFAIGRIFRILPVYYFSLLLLLALLPFEHGRWQGGMPHSPTSLVWCLLLIQSWIGQPTVWNTPGWSLSAESLAYVAFPVLALLVSRLRRPPFILGLAVLALVALTLRFHHRGLTSLNFLHFFALERCLCEFTIGVALGRLNQLGYTGPRLGNALLAGGLLLLLPPMVDSRLDLFAVVAFACLVVSAGTASPTAGALFGNRVAHFLGEISFSIYVLHWPLIELVFRVVPERDLVPGLSLIPAIVIPLAWLTWRWIEVPGQAAGRRLVDRLHEREAKPA